MKTQRTNNPVRKRLYTIQEASTYLGRSIWSVRELIYGGKIPCVKDGKRVFLDLEDMNDWIQKSKIQYTY